MARNVGDTFPEASAPLSLDENATAGGDEIPSTDPTRMVGLDPSS